MNVPKYVVREVDGPDSERGDFEIIHKERSYRDVVVAKRVIDRATAELFAAAPALLAELEAIVYWQDDPNKDTPSWERILHAARDAIALARGKR